MKIQALSPDGSARRYHRIHKDDAGKTVSVLVPVSQTGQSQPIWDELTTWNVPCCGRLRVYGKYLKKLDNIKTSGYKCAFFNVSYDITNKIISKTDLFLCFLYKTVVLVIYQQMA